MPYAPEVPEEVTIDELRSLLEGAGEYLLNIQNDGDRDTDTYEEDVRSAIDFINTHDAVLTAYLSSREQTRAQQLAIGGSNGGGPEAATQQLREQRDIRTIGQRVVAEESYTSWIRRGEADVRNFPGIEVEGVSFFTPEHRTLLDSTQQDMWLPQAPLGVLPRPRQRRMFVRDVLSVNQTTLSNVPYIRELNPVTNETGAATRAEGIAKPEVTMEFEQQDAPIRKIAAWVPATTEIFADAPLLRGYVDTRLNYMLALREEDQVLNGDGVAPNIRGITNTTGLQSQGAADGETAGGVDIPSRVGQAIGKVEAVDGEADAVAMNPLDFWKGVTQRNTDQFDNAFSGPGGAPNSVLLFTWGLPTIRTRAMTQGTALLGSWRLGATMYDRQRVTIRSSDSHDDFFVLNKVAVVAEERVGLAVHRPDFFVEVDIATAAA